MTEQSSPRVWIALGALVAVVIALIGWFAVISPVVDQYGSVVDETTMVEAANESHRTRVALLRDAEEDIDEHRSALLVQWRELPVVPATEESLRQWQSLADRHGVALSGVTIGDPVMLADQQGAGGRPVYAMPVSLHLTGAQDATTAFLHELLVRGQRALRVDALSVAAVRGAEQGLGEAVTVTVGGQIFVAPLTSGDGALLELSGGTASEEERE